MYYGKRVLIQVLIVFKGVSPKQCISSGYLTVIGDPWLMLQMQTVISCHFFYYIYP